VIYWLKILKSKRCQQSQCQNPKIGVQLQVNPFQLTYHVIRRQGGKEKAEKARHFLSCWHWKREKLNNWRRLCNRNRLCLLRKTKATTFWRVYCLILGHNQKTKTGCLISVAASLTEEGSGESDRTGWSSDSSCYSNSTVPTPLSSYTGWFRRNLQYFEKW